jgi:hypothetical protein
MSAPESKSLFQSLTIRGAAALAVAFAASRAGLALPEGAAQEIASAAIDILGALGLIGVAVGRARAKAPLS